MADGSPVGDCVAGFDHSSFFLGTAGNAFNYWLLADLSNNTYGSFSKRSSTSDDFPIAAIERLEKKFKELFNYDLDEDLYVSLPNPFATKASIAKHRANPANPRLLDKSEAGQGLPLWTLAQPARAVDLITTWDNTEYAKPYLWTNGTDLYNSYLYATNHSIPIWNGSDFNYVRTGLKVSCSGRVLHGDLSWSGSRLRPDISKLRNEILFKFPTFRT